MNDFSEQLRLSARRLRDRRNAALRVPSCPRPHRRGAGRWTIVTAAACLGAVVGAVAVRMTSPATTDLTARADTVYVERTVRDTVVRVLPATTPLTAGADPENTSTTTGKTSTTTGKTSTTTGKTSTTTGKTSTTIEIPIAATGISIAATGKTGTTLAKPAGDSRPTDADGLEGLLPVVPLGADFAPAGRSMRDDGVDYSLIVSL